MLAAGAGPLDCACVVDETLEVKGRRVVDDEVLVLSAGFALLVGGWGG